MVLGRPETQIGAEVFEAPRLRGEEVVAKLRMQPIGANDEVEAFFGAGCEGHIHSGRVLADRGDAVSGAVVDLGAAVLDDHPGQVTAQDFDFGHRAVPAEVVGAQSALPSGATVHQGEPFVGLGSGPHLLVDAHAFQDIPAHPTYVDGWPPARNRGAHSTTVTSAPERCSHSASAGPAILAPEISTFRPVIRASLPIGSDRAVLSVPGRVTGVTWQCDGWTRQGLVGD
jgi:hypothetical protein